MQRGYLNKRRFNTPTSLRGSFPPDKSSALRRSRFRSPLESTCDVAGLFAPIGVSRMGRVEGVIPRLRVVRPIGLGHADLNLNAGSRSQASGSARKANLQIVVGPGQGSRQLDDGARYMAAADMRPVTEKVLSDLPINRVIITQQHVGHIDGGSAGVRQLDPRVQRIARCRNGGIILLHLDGPASAGGGIYHGYR